MKLTLFYCEGLQYFLNCSLVSATPIAVLLSKTYLTTLVIIATIF